MKPKGYYFFLIPASCVFLLFFYWPLLQNLYLSFYSWNMISPTKDFVGSANFTYILTSPEFLRVLGNTLLYLIILLILNFVLPYIFSYIMGHLMTDWGGFYRSAFFIPSTISLTVASILFLWIYNPLAGPLSIIMGYFGIESPVWFKTTGLVIFAVSTIVGWKIFGYNLIIMLAAMISVPQDMIEAAKLEGASDYVIFRKIILPMTSPTALYVFTITVVFGLQYVLVPINMLTQGGPDQHSSSLVYIIYQYGFTFFQAGRSAAYAIVSMVIFTVFLLIKSKYLDKKVHYEN